MHYFLFLSLVEISAQNALKSQEILLLISAGFGSGAFPLTSDKSGAFCAWKGNMQALLTSRTGLP